MSPDATCRRPKPTKVLGKLVLWAGEQIRYHRALRELRRLDDRDLDDLNLARIDLPELARRHARMEPISPQA